MAKARRPVQLCAIDGCGARATADCATCARRVCSRHAGAERAAGAGAGAGSRVVRCALCRLHRQKRSAALGRRLWSAAAIVGFLLIDAIAVRANPRQGLALLLVVPLVAVLAYLYDRSLRRNVPLFSLPRRRRFQPPRHAGDGE